MRSWSHGVLGFFPVALRFQSQSIARVLATRRTLAHAMPRASWALATLAWVAAIATGIVMLQRYESKAGALTEPPQTWPSRSVLSRMAGHPTLVLVAHPRCPCTRASLGELAILMSRQWASLRAVVVFVEPAGVPANWVETDLWRRAANIRATRVFRDRDGREARLFGARNSGQTLLYDAGGRLLFSGGITAARGKSGENPGRRAILALLSDQPTTLTSTRVYGCPLDGPVARACEAPSAERKTCDP